jgi:hypothetical protein
VAGVYLQVFQVKAWNKIAQFDDGKIVTGVCFGEDAKYIASSAEKIVRIHSIAHT